MNETTLQAKFNNLIAYYPTHRYDKIQPKEVTQKARNMLKDINYFLESKVSKSDYNCSYAPGTSLHCVPFCIIKNTKYSNTGASEGEYVSYLLNKNGEAIYLTFMISSKSPNFKKRVKAIKSKLQGVEQDKFSNDNSKIKLEDNKNYADATIFHKCYKASHIPNDDILFDDLKEMLNIYEYYIDNFKNEIDAMDFSNQKEEKPTENSTDTNTVDSTITVKQEVKDKTYEQTTIKYDKLDSKAFSDYLASKGFSYSPSLTTNFIAALKAKPFVLLAGISGTGKTQLARKFAEYIGATESNGRYIQVPVRPDWSDSTDLFGHKTLNDGFVEGPILKFIIDANTHPEHPYILCLDEMNLARVEYYFSDFLSVIETRERNGKNITSAPLISDLYDSYKSTRRNSYAPGSKIPDDIYLSDNIYIIGTVNMDESTFPFSKKVLDRAMTIEFSNVELSDNLFGNTVKNKVPTINVHNDDLKARYVAPLEIEDGNRKLAQKIADELAEYNTLLEEAHLHVGYRVRNEIIYYSIYAREMDPSFDYMDYALMQKVLPRIQGSSNNIRNVLLNIYNKARGTSFNADDKVFEKIDGNLTDSSRTDMRQTAKKIRYMLKRLQEDGYTAYWL